MLNLDTVGKYVNNLSLYLVKIETLIVFNSILPDVSSSLNLITLSFKQMSIVNTNQIDQVHDPLRVKFHNMYVFPFKSMYINKFPIRSAEQHVARKPARRAKKPGARQTVRTVAQPAVQTVAQPAVQSAPQPTVQSARAARAVRRLDRKKS